MANGYTQEQMLDRIEQHILRVESKVDMTNIHGCALKPEHDRRLAALEGWKNRGIVGMVSSLLAALGALIVAIVSHITSGK